MAAIDKIYLDSYGDYIQFKKWCLEQPKLKDKYGKEVSIIDYLFTDWDNSKDWKDTSHSVMSAPYYIDAYIIRNCPIKAVQKELMLNYGHKTQEDINEMYNVVTNRTKENEQFYTWLTVDDFKIVDGVVTMPDMEKSDYQKILDGEMYTSPSIDDKYVRGKHFKIVKKPFYNHSCNYPMRYWTKNGGLRQPRWSINVKLPEDIDDYLWWHDKNKIGTWDFSNEFVSSEDGWSSSSTFCNSLKGIKRRILKWKLPVGSIVTLSGRYVGEEYEILVKK